MAKKMLIDATHAEETRVVVVDGNKVEEFDFESENKRQLAGNIYLAKVTRVEPSLQAAFVDYGGNRHGFLAFSEIHPDYYQIPVADREALMEEERAYAEAMKARDEEEEKPKSTRSRSSRSRSKASKAADTDAKVTTEIEGMETIDLDADAEAGADVTVPEGEAASPMETVKETPVETPKSDEEVAEADAEAPAEGEDAPADVASVSEEASADGDAAPVEDADAKGEEAPEDDASDDEEDEVKAKGADATSKDDSIESVADEDDSEDIRPPRKPRPRRYKIQEVIKVRQILLVQVVKEERGNKGAALTTYLSLAGRYCVLMPNTARGGGISRKITNATDRKKLKEIANEIEVPQGAGLIVRTAGAKRTKAEIKRDYEYLQRLWEQIRELTLKSIAPAKIYEEGDLIKRSIRDLYNREIDEVFVEGERGYRIAKDFMKMIMPSHAKNVKQYQDALPLFARYQVETYLAGMFNPTVQLKSGGYIVIGVTEALVAIDVNSGRATKEGSIEETALKTNLEAADEVARQLRLRDLAGLIVIDFIDMDERKNNSAVEKRMKDRLKTDRARIQVGRISGFGLMEMSRQRLRPGMIEATTQPCQACHGTGLIRSDDNLALSILRQIEEEGTRRRSREVLIKAPVGIANFLMNQKREHIAQIEGRYGLSVRIEGDPHLVSPDFSLEKFKTATRVVKAVDMPVVSVDTSIMDQVDEDEDSVAEAPEAPASEDGEPKPKRRRRRRRSRSRSKSSSTETAEAATEQAEVEASEASDTETAHAEPQSDATEAAEAANTDAATEPGEDAPKKTTRSSSSSRTRSTSSRLTRSRSASSTKAKTEEVVDAPAEAKDDDGASAEPAETEAEAAPKKTTRSTRSRSTSTRSKTTKTEEPAPVSAEASTDDVAVVATEPTSVPDAAPEPASAEEAKVPEPVAEEASAPAPDEPPKPKKRGWWSLGK
ncbi:Rne/Rng family ribonuclease [Tateyamaria omphalii]|uniref:Rne/Rng family ribonuclease n=1 Tax=Tateyamaria omphalii TaxID=299262 RepID=UPI001C9A045A|nr:ribonuclease E/G [Tateyamaria omphalii]MBY5932656.1 Rne/Rng family ribonuclease [Tateyamaria omphalii]